MALLEETVSINGQPINTSLGDYLIPVNADDWQADSNIAAVA
jgi:CO/xanthine dehydrogenase Mo-binding subunit